MSVERNSAVWAERVATLVDRWVRWGLRHWLLGVNLALFLYVLLPILAPTFMALGWEVAGRAIYLVYRPLCHQLPERSFFLFGQNATYTVQELHLLGLDPTASSWQRRFFIGSEAAGYKMAFCERDLALYGGMLVAGLLYGLVRTRVRPLPWRAYLLAILPLALDGTTQLVGLRESTWGLRLITGLLFGVATAWALYPRMDKTVREALGSPPPAT